MLTWVKEKVVDTRQSKNEHITREYKIIQVCVFTGTMCIVMVVYTVPSDVHSRFTYKISVYYYVGE